VTWQVRSTGHVGGPWVLDPTARARAWRIHVARRLVLEDARGTGPSRPRSSARRPNPRVAGAHSRGDQHPGEHRPDGCALARAVVNVPTATSFARRGLPRTDSRGEQSSEVGVPATECGEPGRSETRRRKRSRQRGTCGGLATLGTRRPGLTVQRALGLAVARGRRDGEKSREHLGPCRAVGRSTRTHKGERARESGYGSSGRESSVGRLQRARAAWNKAAKRRGTTANGWLREGLARAASAAGSVERGKNPEDGTGGDLAISTLSTRPRGRAGVTRGTRRCCAQGARTPGEAIPGSKGRRGRASGRDDTGARAVETQFSSEEEANSRRGSSGASALGVRLHGEDREAGKNGEAGALEATKALPRRQQDLWRGRQLHESWGECG